MKWLRWTERALFVIGLSLVVVGLVMLAGAKAQAAPTAQPSPRWAPQPMWDHCRWDDGSPRRPRVPCVWDAHHMGNGIGDSFKSIPVYPFTGDPVIVYISHRRAHYLAGFARPMPLG